MTRQVVDHGDCDKSKGIIIGHNIKELQRQRDKKLSDPVGRERGGRGDCIYVHERSCNFLSIHYQL